MITFGNGEEFLKGFSETSGGEQRAQQNCAKRSHPECLTMDANERRSASLFTLEHNSIGFIR